MTTPTGFATPAANNSVLICIVQRLAAHHRANAMHRKMRFCSKEWNERQKRVEDAKWGDDEEEEAEEEGDELPFACYLCRKPWAEIRDPVVTRCKHYFCETCALRHNSLNKAKCAICEQPTNGIFNVANDIVKKVKEQKKKDDEGS